MRLHTGHAFVPTHKAAPARAKAHLQPCPCLGIQLHCLWRLLCPLLVLLRCQPVLLLLLLLLQPPLPLLRQLRHEQLLIQESWRACTRLPPWPKPPLGQAKAQGSGRGVVTCGACPPWAGTCAKRSLRPCRWPCCRPRLGAEWLQPARLRQCRLVGSLGQGQERGAVRGGGGQNNRQRCATRRFCLLQQSLGQKCARGARLLLLLRWLRRLLLRCNGRKLLAHSVHSGAECVRRAGRAGWWVWYAAGAATGGLFSPHGRQTLHHADIGARLSERQAHQLQSGSRRGWVQCLLSGCSRLWRLPTACMHSVPPHPTTTLLRHTAANSPPPLTCWRLRMCSTLASSSS